MEKQQDDLREVLDIFKDGMTEFNKAMQLREDFAVRIGRRTTQIIRFSMFGIIMIGSVMFALIFTLLSQMWTIKDSMIEMDKYMGRMDKNFLSVAKNMEKMDKNFLVVAKNVEDMNLSVKEMADYISKVPNMHESVVEMSSSIKLMEEKISSMSSDMTNMSYQFTGLNGYVGSMGYNVNRMAAPMKMFPFP